MAADLAADLKEAEDDGASPEEVLGSGAFDPRSFAASWAAERGVIPPRTAKDEATRSEQGVSSSTQVGKRPRRPRLLAVIAACAVVALIGAVFTFGSVSSVAVVRVASAAGPNSIRLIPSRPIRVLPPGTGVFPGGGIGPFAPAGIIENDRAATLRALGPVLLVLGLLGLVVTSVYLFRARPAKGTAN
jgi:hypothetical protein